jgi:hypothetical protein
MSEKIYASQSRASTATYNGRARTARRHSMFWKANRPVWERCFWEASCHWLPSVH